MDQNNKARRQLILNQAASYLTYMAKLEEVGDLVLEDDIRLVADLVEKFQKDYVTDILSALAFRDGINQTDLAQLRGCSRSRINQMVAKGERVMKHPLRIQLIDFSQRPPRTRGTEVVRNSLRTTAGLYIPNHILNRLERHGIVTLEQFLERTPEQLREIPGISPIQLIKIQLVLAEQGLALAGTSYVEILGKQEVSRLISRINHPSMLSKLNEQGINTIAELLQRRQNELGSLSSRELEDLQFNLRRLKLELKP